MRTSARLATLALLVTICAASALVLPQGVGSQEDDSTEVENTSTPAAGTFTALPAEGLTGAAITVSGSSCTLLGSTAPGDAVVVTLAPPEGEAVATTSLAVAEDGTWTGGIAAPLGTPAGELVVGARCIAPEQELVAYAPQPHTITGEGTASTPLPTSTLEAPDPALATASEAETRAATAEASNSGAAGLPNRTFAAPIEPLPSYDPQSTCSPSTKPGVAAFQQIVMEAFPSSGWGNVGRSCNEGGTSEHKEGRAWDWTVNVSNATQAGYASQLLDWLLATDAAGNRYANARRTGIMYIIWNRHMFRMYDPERGWQPYTGANPHTDHVHLSFTRAGGAGTTTYWTSPPDPCNGQTHRPFCDISPNHQFRTEIMWVADNGIANGYSDTSFRPLDAVSRQAMAAFLYRLRGVSYTPRATGQTFTDVARTSPFFREIEWLRSAEIGDGFADGRFLPLSPVSRQAMSAFMYRAAGQPTYAAPPAPSFNDTAVGRPFYREIHWLASRGISTGYADGTFRPDAAVSRQAMAAFLKRLDPLV